MRISEIIVEELRVDPGLDGTARSVYLWAMAYQPVSVRQLAVCFGGRWHSVRMACRKLAAAGWMRLEESQREHRPVPLLPLRVQAKLAQGFERDYAMAENKGEFLMKRLVDLYVRCGLFMDNARAEFLVNPSTGHQLEYDRYCHGLGVAFEFNGPQHYGAAQGYTDRQTNKDIETRDLLKESLSRRAGVELITITSEGLRPNAFKALLPAHLPRNHVDEDGPYFKAVARLCTAYADRAARESAKGHQKG